ncbi:MAG: hypothetical protein V3575_04630 [Candidatus Absconditabacteria bacterium]
MKNYINLFMKGSVFGLGVFVTVFLCILIVKGAWQSSNPTAGLGDATNLYTSGEDTLTKEKWNALVEKVYNNGGGINSIGDIVTTYLGNTIYQANQDGIILAYCNGTGRLKSIQSINSNLSNPIMSWESEHIATGAARERVILPIKKNNYRKIEVLGGCSQLKTVFFPLQ